MQDPRALNLAASVALNMVKAAISVLPRVVSLAALCVMPPAWGAGDGVISPAELQAYQSRQELALKHEQVLHAARSAPRTNEEWRRQRQRFEAERIHQRQLLERQRRRIAAERLRLRPAPRPESSRGFDLQRLRRAQASERLSRKLLR